MPCKRLTWTSTNLWKQNRKTPKRNWIILKHVKWLEKRLWRVWITSDYNQLIVSLQYVLCMTQVLWMMVLLTHWKKSGDTGATTYWGGPDSAGGKWDWSISSLVSLSPALFLLSPSFAHLLPKAYPQQSTSAADLGIYFSHYHPSALHGLQGPLWSAPDSKASSSFGTSLRFDAWFPHVCHVFLHLHSFLAVQPSFLHHSLVGVKWKSLVMSDSLQPHGLYSPWNSPGQNTGAGSLSLLQGIFPTQGSNTGLPCCGPILYQLSHKGSTRVLGWVAYPFSRGSSWPKNRTRVSCIAGRFFINWTIRVALMMLNCSMPHTAYL